MTHDLPSGLTPAGAARIAARTIGTALVFFAALASCAASLHAQAVPHKPAPITREPKDFGGTWKAAKNGKVFFLLKIAVDHDKMAGTVSLGDVKVDEKGYVAEVISEAADEQPLIEPKFADGKFSFSAKEEDEIVSFEFVLLSVTRGELKYLTTPGDTPVPPLILVRQRAKP